jgi:hypothetical protein
LNSSVRGFLLVAAAVALGALSAACANADKPTPAPPVFISAPWRGVESEHYQLSSKAEADAGICELKTEPGADGKTVLSRLCSKDEFRDDGVATVKSDSLQPIQVTRTRTDSKKDKRTTFTNTFDTATVQFKAEVDGKVNQTTRDLPVPTGKVPNPAWYDDESTLWLARTVNLSQGYQSEYTLVINAGAPHIHNVEVRVEGAETVEVPAGAFQAWKVRYRYNGSVNYVWVETAAPHRVIQARIEDVTYKLTGSG